MPGRKTDVVDCVWLAQLLEYGLLRASFIPPQPIRDLRDLTRYRKVLAEEHTRAANRVEKMLQDAGIKLSSVATDNLGASGRQILAALVAGNTDPQALAELARGRLRGKRPQLAQALSGRFREHHAFLIGQLLVNLDNIEDSLAALTTRIEVLLNPFVEELKLVSHHSWNQADCGVGDYLRDRRGYDVLRQARKPFQLVAVLSAQ